MINLRKYLSSVSLFIIVILLILLLLALFTEGFTRDIFLEAAAFLISAYLITMAHKNKIASDSLLEKLNDIYKKVDSIAPPQQ